MKRLNDNDIQDLPDVPTKEIELKDWNVSILIQGITKAMQIELGAMLDKEEFQLLITKRTFVALCC